jgi:pheromone shutdown protein TraB
VRFAGGSGCSSAALQESVRRVIEEAAPEIETVELDEPAAQLVTLRTHGTSP